MTRDELLHAVQRLLKIKSEAERGAVLDRLEAAFPHAGVSDLVFYGEKERTNQDIVEEVFNREDIWSRGGENALHAHLEQLALATLSDASIPDMDYRKIDARRMLETLRSSRKG